VKVRDIMTPIVQSVPPDTSVENAARIMRLHDIGLLPVGEGENILGVLTDRDIAIRVTAQGLDAKHTPVREVMSNRAHYCFEDEEIEDACFVMEDKKVRRLVVFDRSRILVGILSIDDVAVKARREKLSGHILSKLGKIA